MGGRAYLLVSLCVLYDYDALAARASPLTAGKVGQREELACLLVACDCPVVLLVACMFSLATFSKIAALLSLTAVSIIVGRIE